MLNTMEVLQLFATENAATENPEATTQKPLDTKNDHLPPLQLFYWYLYTGSEDRPKYCSRNYKVKKYLTPDQLTCVPKLVKDLTNAKLMVEAIEHAMAGSHHMEPCVYALALGIASTEKVTTANPIRSLLYNTASTILTTSDEILFFVNSLAILKTGVGKGWRKCISKWFKNMPVEKLAVEVSRVKSRYGWTHKDVLKLLHFKEDKENKPLMIIFHYIWNGLKSTLEKFSSMVEFENILMPLRVTDELRHTEDAAVAAELIKTHDFLGVDHVPVHLINSPVVWNALILKMAPADIARSIERLYLSLLTVNPADETIPKELLPATVTEQLIKTLDNSIVSPLLAYKTLMDYNAAGRAKTHVKQIYLSKDKSAKFTLLANMAKKSNEKEGSQHLKNWHWQRRKGLVTPPNEDLLKSLQSLLDRSITKGYELDNKIDAHFLVALDLSDIMFKGVQQCRVDRIADLAGTEKSIRKKHQLAQCFDNKNLVPGHVAMVLTQELCCRVKNVTVVIMTENGMEEIEVKKNGALLSYSQLTANIADYMSRSRKLTLSTPILDAESQKKKYDLFVMVVHSVCRHRAKGKPETTPLLPANALKAYHETMGSKDAGFVTVSLGGHKGATQQLEDGRRILDIFGADEHAVDLITAFATTAKDKI